jgi:inosine/xanthosine triphosphate pyrophosphatase family protein
MRSVTFVTANTSKLEEVKAIASDFLEINSVSLDCKNYNTIFTTGII